jgi:anti-sigma factor RsiW
MSEKKDHLHPTDALSDYLDRELAPARRAAVEAHLAGCAECSGILEELRAVTLRARQLPDPPLERDLWPGIEQRLADPRPEHAEVARPAGFGWLWGRRFSLSMPQLAATALALIAISGGTVWWALRAPGSGAGGRSEAIVSSVPLAEAPQGAAVDAGPAAATGGESLANIEPLRYDAAIADLQRTVDENRGRLDPATLRTVEADLAIIDKAIDQARRALLADPSSPYLNGHLAEQLRRKLRVLRRTADAMTADFTGSNS